VKIRYDRAGRSEGLAFVIYNNMNDARTAIREFDGANAKGQPIRVTLLGPSNGARRGGRNPFDNVEKPKGSLFDRVEDPKARNERSLSPDGERRGGGDGRRRGRRDEGRLRHSDVSKPAPEHIDRYIPGHRSPVRRNGGGRRPGERRDAQRRTDSQGRPTVKGRPKKTQEELDAEMDDYWGNSANTGDAAATAEKPAAAAASTAEVAAPTAAAPATADDDVDMIE
jgi:THO complex subunit 4